MLPADQDNSWIITGCVRPLESMEPPSKRLRSGLRFRLRSTESVEDSDPARDSDDHCSQASQALVPLEQCRADEQAATQPPSTQAVVHEQVGSPPPSLAAYIDSTWPSVHSCYQESLSNISLLLQDGSTMLAWVYNHYLLELNTHAARTAVCRCSSDLVRLGNDLSLLVDAYARDDSATVYWLNAKISDAVKLNQSFRSRLLNLPEDDLG